MPRFRDRADAGVQLASRLDAYANRKDVVVLALPRGGVPVGFEVAQRLKAPLDVFVVRKLGMPGHPELAMGAIASGGVRVINEDVTRAYGIGSSVIHEVAKREQVELERRERAFRDDRPPLQLRGRSVVLVDDGLATGSTMKAAVQAVRAEGADEIIVAVPVGSPDVCDELSELADAVICAHSPAVLSSVGEWYLDFTQTSDAEVRKQLRAAHAHVEQAS
jgi:putative phosphoribosyl transferase